MKVERLLRNGTCTTTSNLWVNHHCGKLITDWASQGKLFYTTYWSQKTFLVTLSFWINKCINLCSMSSYADFTRCPLFYVFCVLYIASIFIGNFRLRPWLPFALLILYFFLFFCAYSWTQQKEKNSFKKINIYKLNSAFFTIN